MSLSPDVATATIWLGGTLAAYLIAPAPILSELNALFSSAGAEWYGPGRPGAVLLQVRPHPTRRETRQLIRDGNLVSEFAESDDLLPILEWAICSAAIEHLAEAALLFHAGAVARHGQGLLLPAPPGSGKTTLVAGLLRSGFKYLSEEVGVVDPVSGLLWPFPRSLHIKHGARSVLAPLYPELAGIGVHAVGPESVAYFRAPADVLTTDPATIEYLVLPQYAVGAETRLVPLARSGALRALLEQSFNARARGPSAVLRAGQIVQSAECYGLTIGSLTKAVSLLCTLVGEAAG